MESKNQMWSGCSVAMIIVLYEKGREHVAVDNAALTAAGSIGNLLGESIKGPEEYGRMTEIDVWFHTPTDPNAFVIVVTNDSSAIFSNGETEPLSLSLDALWSMTSSDISTLLEEHARFLTENAYIEEEDGVGYEEDDGDGVELSWWIDVSDPDLFISLLSELPKRAGVETVDDAIKLHLVACDQDIIARLVTEPDENGDFPEVVLENGEAVEGYYHAVDVFVCYNAFMAALKTDWDYNSMTISYSDEDDEGVRIVFERKVLVAEQVVTTVEL